MNHKNKPFSPNKIVTPFIISIACIMVFFLATLIYLFSSGPSRFIKYQTIEFKNHIIQTKKDYTQATVDRVIQDIEIEEKILISRLKKENPAISQNKSLIDSIIKEEMYVHIHNTKLINLGYIYIYIYG